jgi:hypothetical protein
MAPRHLADDTTEPWLEREALQAMESDDSSDWAGFEDTGSWLPVVFRNREQLSARGTFERALLRAFRAFGDNGGTHCERDAVEIEALFLTHANRDRLLEEGDPLPEGDDFVVFRGVAGTRERRREHGLSWSLDRAVAERFAQAGKDLGLANPMVLEGSVRRADVLAYVSRRAEAEIIAKHVTIRAKHTICA